MIFAHGVNFFSITMPAPVHKIEGSSDFTALTPVDAGLTSASEPDKAHHQYVWIFRIAPCTFDPENFSPRRRFQFSQVESNALASKAGPKAVEDAFRFHREPLKFDRRNIGQSPAAPESIALPMRFHP